MKKIKPSFCRICNAFCPVDVAIENGSVVNVQGNHRAPLYGGYTCPKGRALPQLHNHPKRLLKSLKKQPDGSFKEISSVDLLDEVSDKFAEILSKHGPRSVAGYLTSGVLDQPAAVSLVSSFFRAIGSPMMFTAATIDQPGLAIAHALHGSWEGGRVRPENRDVFVIIGGNPISSKQYLPQNPGMQLKAMRRRGAKLIVIDPRHTETARLADIHLQPIPGEDPTILAGLVRLIITEGGVSEAFVALNAEGIERLKQAVEPFTPDYVSSRAGLDEGDLRAVAKMLIDADKGDIVTGVGASMSTRGEITNYLAMCLNTLRGFWAAEGDDVMAPSVLFPSREYKAQPSAPYPAWGFGLKTRVRELEETVAGLPTAAFPEEVLTPGEGQIKAFFCLGGPMQSWPEQSKTIEALEALELMVTHDTMLTPTAKMADYVIATKMHFEVPAITFIDEMVANVARHSGYGYSDPFSIYTPALVEPPEGSDLIEAWEIYYHIAKKLNIPLAAMPFAPPGEGDPVYLDMNTPPSTDDIYDFMCHGSAVPLEEIRKYPDGHIFEEARKTVGPRDSDCDAYFDLGNSEMMDMLDTISTESITARRKTDDEYSYLLISSRMQNSQNATSALGSPSDALKWSYNPLFMNSSDMKSAELCSGDTVTVKSHNGEVTAILEEDNGLRQGVVAIMHGFGGFPDKDYDFRRDGTNVNQLTAWNDDNDPRTGMPRMSAIPVSISVSAVSDTYR